MQLPILQSLRARLVASYLLAVLAGIGLITVLAGRSIYEAKRNQIEDHYSDLLLSAARDLEQPLIDQSSGQVSLEGIRQAASRWFSVIPEARYAVFQPDGKLLLASDGAGPAETGEVNPPEVQQALQPGAGVVLLPRQNSQGVNALFLAFRIDHSGAPSGVLRLEVPAGLLETPARSSLTWLIIASLAVAILLSALGLWMANSLSPPIKNVTDTAERLSQGDLSARAAVPPAPLELRRLAEALNTMAAKMQANMVELRGFVANASHELRTPLTSVKLRVEALRAGALQDQTVADRFLTEIESEVDRLSRMVSDLLDLSRIEAGLAPKERAPLDLGTVAQEVCEVFRARAERMGATLSLEIQPALPLVMGNEDQLRRVLYNLVDNAIKYTTRNGRVEVAVQTNAAGNYVQLRVFDSGYGIPPEHLAHIFERFYRVEATRPRYGPEHGSGLGLPIARSIVEIHGGKISVTSKIQEGTTFLVELPILESSSEK
jgi:signal transduction histidine kinase